jgi:PAS domain-containing protein
MRAKYRQVLSALHNMSQGLVVYDGKRTARHPQQRFLEIYGLSPDEVKPGTFLIDVLKRRRDKYNLASDPTLTATISSRLAAGRSTERPATPDRDA